MQTRDLQEEKTLEGNSVREMEMEGKGMRKRERHTGEGKAMIMLMTNDKAETSL